MKNKNSHTPGPWSLRSGRHDEESCYVVADNDGGQIAGNIKIDIASDTARANASLIACAPELLKELRILVLQVCGDKALDGTHKCHRCAPAKEAIAKVEGGIIAVVWAEDI